MRWWQRALVPVLVLPLLAILMPVYAYSGPGPGGVAASIAHERRDTGVWPKAYHDPAGRFDYALERVEKGEAVYRLRAGRDREEWWVAERGAGGSPASERRDDRIP